MPGCGTHNKEDGKITSTNNKVSASVLTEGGKAVTRKVNPTNKRSKVSPKISKKKGTSKRGQALEKYNKKLDDVIKNNSNDKKVKNMKDVRALAKKEFAKISDDKKKGKGTALKLYNNEVDKVLEEKVGVKNRKALHALVKKN